MELLLKAFEEDLAELNLSEAAQKSPAAFYFLRALGRLVEESQHDRLDAIAFGLPGITNSQAAGLPGRVMDWTI